jgi:hypothetical protein
MDRREVPDVVHSNGDAEKKLSRTNHEHHHLFIKIGPSSIRLITRIAPIRN